MTPAEQQTYLREWRRQNPWRYLTHSHLSHFRKNPERHWFCRRCAHPCAGARCATTLHDPFELFCAFCKTHLHPLIEAAEQARAALAAQPAEGLDVERLARAIAYGEGYKASGKSKYWLERAGVVAAEYDRLREGGGA